MLRHRRLWALECSRGKGFRCWAHAAVGVIVKRDEVRGSGGGVLGHRCLVGGSDGGCSGLEASA